MPSSISNSKSAALLHARVLAALCLALVLAFEAAANYLVRRDSETYTRVSGQYAEALKLRPSGPGEPLAVLMAGNSLLMEGIEVERLQKLTAGSMRICPIFLEATGYYDWLYGLQRLFRQGARPQVVVLGIGVDSFLDNSVRLEYAPIILFDGRDVLAVASDLRLDNTATSNLILAHTSMFWDVRSVIRTQVLRRIVPRSRELFSLIKSRPSLLPDEELEAIAISRLKILRDLCEAHGARLIFLIPPTPSSQNAVRLLREASARAGVDPLIPIDPASLSHSFYQSDAIHLNSQGAELFTSALAVSLPREVGESIASPD